MIEILSSMPGRLLPERHILVRNGTGVRQIVLSTALQATLVLVLLTSTATAGIMAYRTAAAHKIESQTVADLNTQLAAEHQAATAARHELAVLADPSGTPDDAADPKALAAKVNARIDTLQQGLQAATHQRETAQSQREQLAAEKGKLQTKLGELETAKSKTEENLAAEREKLRTEVTAIEKRLRKNGHLPAHIVVPGKLAEADVPPDDAAASSANAASLDRVMSRLGIGMRGTRNAGGPYVALGGGKSADVGLEAETKAALSRLPLAAPLDHYELESEFGVRSDPMNGREAMHTGVDLSAPYRTPVHSTAAGEVVFAGYAAGYGKMVEIDHGQGIHTRYAHLNRLMTNVGQHVGKHDVVGLLGSSGRSTGPHVHYEVLLNGVAQNPQRFLDAGRSATVIKAGD